MSQSLTVLMNRADVPAREALEASFKALKFKLSVDGSYVPLVTAGYLPCTLNGEDGGVDVRFGEASAYVAQFPELAEPAGRADTAVQLRSGGDPREVVCVLMVAASLAQQGSAVVHDPKKKLILTAEKLISQARARFDELE